MAALIGFPVLLAVFFLVFGDIGLALAFSVILYGIGWLLVLGIRAVASVFQKVS